MAIPAVTQTIQDNSTGLVPGNTSAVTIVAGTCSSGTAETVYGPYYGADAIDDLVGDLVSGPAVKAAAYHLSQNGSAIYVVPTDTTGGTAGALSSVTSVATGSMTVAVTGTPKDDYEWKLVCVTGGERGTATYKLSLDGGQTFRATFTSAASVATYASETGITWTFTAGSGDDAVAGDYYTGTATAAVATAANYGDAIDAAVSEGISFGLVHLVGCPAGADNAAKSAAAESRCSSAHTQLVAAEASYVYARAFNDSTNVSDNSTGDTALISAFSSSEHNRTFQCAGFADILDPIDETWQKRPISWAVVSRARNVEISEDVSFVGSQRGSLGSTVRLVRNIDGVKTYYLDSRKRSTLANDRFTTLRTHLKLLGAYVCESKSLAAVGSDFAFLPNCRVIDRASETTYTVLVKQLNGRVRVNSNGTILEEDALAIEKYGNTVLRSALSGQCSAVQMVVNRTDNLLATPTLRVRTTVTPFGYNRQISNVLSFLNPALTVVG